MEKRESKNANKYKSDDPHFNVKFVKDTFLLSLLDNDDIELGAYLGAYSELGKFCHLMGSVMGFVGSEIGGKMEVLMDLRDKDTEDQFATMKTMVNYEMESNLLNNPKYTSGCRTMLRLHRGLDFMRTFLQRVSALGPDDATSTVGQEVYSETLAKFHPWLIRKGAILAMYVLPTKEGLLHRVCGNKTELALKTLPEMLEVTNQVYNCTQKCFTDHDLLNLP